MPAFESPQTGGLSRRTILKASAWSAPVVALAVATPLAAASTTSSAVRYIGTAGSSSEPVLNDSGTRSLVISQGARARLGSFGPDEITSGTVLTITYDTQLHDSFLLVIGATPQTPTSSSTSGNATTLTFLIAQPLPVIADGDFNAGLNLAYQWSYEGATYREDYVPGTLVITPPTPGDPGLSVSIETFTYEDVTP